MPGERAPTVADLEMAMASVRETAYVIAMIALRLRIDAINQAVPVAVAMQPIAGRLLWEPLGAWSPEGEVD